MPKTLNQTPLRIARKKLGLTFAQASDSSGVPVATLHTLERHGADPKLSTARKLARAYDQSIFKLFPE